MSAPRKDSDDSTRSVADPATMSNAPWLADAKSALAASRSSERIPHALLIQGATGTGADKLALWIAQLVLCQRGGTTPCGHCPSCRWVTALQHPDLVIVRPAEESKQIRVDQIRELCAALALTSHQGGYKSAIVDPADSLNHAAANALLKTLEEPAPRTLLMLVSAQPSRLPATLVSRCQRIRLRRPSRAESRAWLQEVRGAGDWDAVLDVIGEAPLTAAELDPQAIAAVRSEVGQALDALCESRADPVATAEQWSRSELPLRLACVENWLTDRIRRGLGVGADAPEVRTTQRQPGASVDKIAALFRRLEEVRALKAALAGPINRSLALESVLRSLEEAPGRMTGESRKNLG